MSVPDDLMRDAEAAARAPGKTKSGLVRDALRRQVELEQLRGLQRYGRRLAEERGIEPEDAERLPESRRQPGRGAAGKCGDTKRLFPVKRLETPR